MLLHAAMTFPRGHRPAQLIGFARRIAGRDDRQLHHLFLEQRHAERAFEHRLEILRRIIHRLLAATPAQVGMHHVALNRPGPHDRHLDHQVVEIRRPVPRQHRHLRAALDLEHTDGVGVLDHAVSGRVLVRQAGQGVILATLRTQQIQTLAHAAEHAQRQAIDLEQLHRVQVVLVPLDDGAIGHRRVFHRHQLAQRRVADHEAAHVLRQMPRHVEQFGGEFEHPPQHRAVRVEAAFAQGCIERAHTIPPGKDRAQLIHLVRRQTQRLGHVAHRALAAIADHRGRQRRTLAAVLVIDVLDHLLAPLVLEIHVDVGRLVALLADEALDQQVHPRRVDLGHAECETHGGIGGRAAALAEDLLAARVAHDVVHGEEIRFVFQLLDQAEFVLDLRADLFRRAVRPAPAHALLGELTQPADRAVPGRHQLVRVAVCQLVQTELTARGDRHALLQQGGRIDRRQRLAPAQVALAVAEDQRAGLGDRQPMANRGQRVLQREPATHMHVHIAGGDQAQIETGRQHLQLAQALRIVGAVVQFHRQPDAIAEGRAQPAPVCRVGMAFGQPQGERSRQAIGQVGGTQPIRALVRGTPATRDQPAQGAVAGAVLAQQHQLRAILQLEFGAHDQFHAGLARGLQRAHDTGQRAFVGDRQRAVTAASGALEQLARAGGATPERERRQAVQLGIRIHANQPCSIQPACSPGAQNAHARWPCAVSTT